MIRNRIIFGQGAQSWRHIPFDDAGQPVRITAATYTIVDMTEATTSSSRVVVPTTAAATDTADTTLSAAAGRNAANARALPVVSTASMAENVAYLLATADGGGHRELVTADRVAVAGLTLHAQRDVRGVYASGDTVQGIELTATFPASVADDEDLAITDRREYQILWSYSIEGRAYLVPERVAVERYSVAPWITPEDVLRGHESLSRRVARTAIPDAIAAATDEIEGELEASRVLASYYRPTKSGRMAARYLALHMLYADLDGDRDEERATTFRERFKYQIHQMIEGRPEGARIIDRQDDTAAHQGDRMDILVPT